jgi:flagellar motor protein MotB
MRRRLVQPVARPLRASGDRWLFGYADVVTLLFASFAALYAAQAAPASDSGAPARIRPPLVGDDSAARTLASLTPQLMMIATSSRGVVVDLSDRAGGLTMSVGEAGSFAPGSAELTDDAAIVLRQFADAVRAHPATISVEGHTDDLPISTPVFASNWELSTARATRVVQFLIEHGGLAPARLSAAGFAEHRPRVANTGDASRARNRRVDLIVGSSPAHFCRFPGELACS